MCSSDLGLYETGLHIAARDLASSQLKEQLGVKTSPSDGGEFALPGYGAYETADGRWIYIIMLTDMHWKRSCEALAIPAELCARYATMRDRKKDRAAVEEILRTAGPGASADQLVAVVKDLIGQRGTMHLAAELKDQMREMEKELWYSGEQDPRARAEIKQQWTTRHAAAWRRWRIQEYLFVVGLCREEIAARLQDPGRPPA